MYETAERFWDAEAEKEPTRVKGWMHLEPVSRHIALKVTGDRQGEIWTYVTRKYFSYRRPVDRILSLGCGLGSLERCLARLELFKACDAMDISGRSIAVAEAAARRAGFNHINYQQANLDRLSLTPGRYDAVFANSILHHLRELESVLSEISASLKERGLLIVNEYIGPSQFQFSDREIDAMNAAISLLPPEYRRLPSPVDQATDVARVGGARSFGRVACSRLATELRRGTLLGTLKRKATRMRAGKDGHPACWEPMKRISIEEQEAVDPSEAVRSGEIIPVLKERFEILERRDYGGTLLQFGLASIAQNFAEPTEEATALLNMLLQIEDTLIEHGDLPSHFSMIIARPR